MPRAQKSTSSAPSPAKATKRTAAAKATKTTTSKAAAKPAEAATETASTHGADHPAPKAATVAAKGARKQFFAAQRERLQNERQTYTRQADELKAQADSLALEHEPGDVQFDEEGGEGGTSNVDRELDLVLSGQARATILEIDRALAKLDDGTYGSCEKCGTAIPEARLEALPHASLCVACKSGGLSSRR